MRRMRLDVALVERGLEQSRERARRLVVAGEVTVNGLVARAPSTMIDPEATLVVGKTLPYVGRGGLKLAHALDHFQLDVTGRVCLDAGASTGGFTDCLLQRGAAQVYAVDVGKGQLAWTLRQDPRVVVMEEVNVRYLRLAGSAGSAAAASGESAGSAPSVGSAGAAGSAESSRLGTAARITNTSESRRARGARDAGADSSQPPATLPKRVSLAVIDVAFISLGLVLPAITGVLEPGADVVALVKPQFEAGPADARKGIVRDPMVHRRVLHGAMAAARSASLAPAGLTASPIRGQAGNVEFLLWAIAAEGTSDWPGTSVETGVSSASPMTTIAAIAAPRPGHDRYLDEVDEADAIERALDEARAAR